jgi:hypothetical protein
MKPIKILITTDRHRFNLYYIKGYDLGIRLPVCENEAANPAAGAAQYTKAQIPQFIIDLGERMDAFDMDEEAKTVTIRHNMNKIIVANETSKYVIPFN